MQVIGVKLCIVPCSNDRRLHCHADSLCRGLEKRHTLSLVDAATSEVAIFIVEADADIPDTLQPQVLRGS